MARRRVALIFGGRSAEHEISIISARAVGAQINRDRFEVAPIYIARDGRWHGGACAEKILALDMSSILRSGTLEDARRVLDGLTSDVAGDTFDFTEFGRQTDVAFLVLHGSYGEDGRIQGCLETFGIPYTGCHVAASAVGMDKALTKICAAAAGVEIAGFMTVLRSEFRKDPAKTAGEVASRFSWPVFVKPASLGSSVGIFKVHDEAELLPALEAACSLDVKVLVETAVSGREIEVAVLGNDEPFASLPGEVVPGSEFYDYEDKYIKNSAQLFIPARLTGEQTEAIRSAAVTVFRALGCSGLSRVDFFLENGTDRIILNEVNTIPGFTDVSMYPMMMAASGIPFPELVERLLGLALEKQQEN